MSSPENRRSSPLARERAKILAATVRRAGSALPTTFTARTCAVAAALLLVFSLAAAAQQPRRIFISVDMEGIGGVGTPAMTSAGGKDYELARRLMTDEVNAVVAAIFESGPATVLVNDSHGDMQNLLHTELDPRVTYIQGAVKPVGMVAGLDSTFDAAFFIGYHARAGTPNGFLAHTGTGSVKGLWLNDREAGEGDLNAAYAAALGVPVVLASGDSAFVAQFGQSVDAELVTTKWAVTDVSARLIHPKVVHERLAAATKRALSRSGGVKQPDVGKPVRVRMRFSDTALPQILEAIPGVKRVDGYTVGFTAANMTEAYPIIRLMYRFVRI
ncbi:MAG TPA: M55 family metallopeptidase [Gemmatimonadaceae bacterium]|jgi:D-amino peptidase|nr:M55 family metallopeptidase [Gemmatimonadaceae bacterium]